MLRLLITGGSGQIGGAIINRLDELVAPEDKVYLLQHQTPIRLEGNRKDLEIIYSLGDARQKKYDVAIHLAANLHTKFGQRPAGPLSLWNPEVRKHYRDFYDANVVLTKNVCAVAGRVLYFSSDNVFNGLEKKEYLENDPSCPPPNFYGETKAIAENIVGGHGGAVIRIQTLLGVQRNLIVDKVYETLDGTKHWKFWNDQFVRPSHFDDLFPTLKKALYTYESAIYHVSCTGKAPSRWEIAKKILQVHESHNIPLANKIVEEEICTIPDFPRYLALNTRKTCADLGLTFMSVEDAIKKHVLHTRAHLKKEAMQMIK